MAGCWGIIRGEFRSMEYPIEQGYWRIVYKMLGLFSWGPENRISWRENRNTYWEEYTGVNVSSETLWMISILDIIMWQLLGVDDVVSPKNRIAVYNWK